MSTPRGFWPNVLDGLYLGALWRWIAKRLDGLAQGGKPCRSDGRCQYAIDHGAEGLGACPTGVCVMAQGGKP